MWIIIKANNEPKWIFSTHTNNIFHNFVYRNPENFQIWRVVRLHNVMLPIFGTVSPIFMKMGSKVVQYSQETGRESSGRQKKKIVRNVYGVDSTPGNF